MPLTDKFGYMLCYESIKLKMIMQLNKDELQCISVCLQDMNPNPELARMKLLMCMVIKTQKCIKETNLFFSVL